jgi:hypothetical protein
MTALGCVKSIGEKSKAAAPCEAAAHLFLNRWRGLDVRVKTLTYQPSAFRTTAKATADPSTSLRCAQDDSVEGLRVVA